MMKRKQRLTEYITVRKHETEKLGLYPITLSKGKKYTEQIKTIKRHLKQPVFMFITMLHMLTGPRFA